MSVSNFIPQIWSARLLNSLDKAHVVTSLVNRDYEGEITQCGDKVKIASIGDITISDYTSNANISDPQEIPVNQQLLEISEQKYYNFQIDDVDKAQTHSSIMDAAMQKSGYALSDITDKWLAEKLVAGTNTENCIGTDAAPEAVDDTNVYSYLMKIKTLLDKNNVPTIGRWLLVPPEFHNLLLMDERFTGTGGAVSEGMLQNGLVGMAAGFQVYMSNNLPVSGDILKVVGGCSGAATYAEQILHTEAYRMEKRFADGVKGLHVYGAKVTRGDQLAVLTCEIDSI